MSKEIYEHEDDAKLYSYDIYCLNCNYDLRGMKSNHCPECGEKFDPNDEQTFCCFSREKCIKTKSIMWFFLIPILFILFLSIIWFLDSFFDFYKYEKLQSLLRAVLNS